MSTSKNYQYNYSPSAEAVEARKHARKAAVYTVVTLITFAAIGAMLAWHV